MAHVSTRTAFKRLVRLYSGDVTNDALRQAFSYCVTQVRSHDYENYVWCTQLPKELRPPIFALRAFNVETALIAEHAKSDMLIMMRSQWWRDSINSAYRNQAPDQPIIRALSSVMHGHAPLTRYRLQQIISVREQDMLRKEPLKTLQELENYAEGTASQLLYLQMEAGGFATSPGESSSSGMRLHHAVSHAGKAVGMAALLRGTLHHAHNQKTYLPLDICEKNAVSPNAIAMGEMSPAVQDVIQELATVARGHLNAARAHSEVVPTGARQLLLPTVSCEMYLSALEAAEFDPLHLSLTNSPGYSPLSYQLQLKYTMLRGKY